MPVEDGGGGPGGEAFCAAGAMVGGGEGAGGALAGRNDEAAGAQPCGDFEFGRIVWPHVSVIRHRALEAQGREMAVMRLYTG